MVVFLRVIKPAKTISSFITAICFLLKNIYSVMFMIYRSEFLLTFIISPFYLSLWRKNKESVNNDEKHLLVIEEF
jgi:hypothetical protein